MNWLVDAKRQSLFRATAWVLTWALTWVLFKEPISLAAPRKLEPSAAYRMGQSAQFPKLQKKIARKPAMYLPPLLRKKRYLRNRPVFGGDILGIRVAVACADLKEGRKPKTLNSVYNLSLIYSRQIKTTSLKKKLCNAQKLLPHRSPLATRLRTLYFTHNPLTPLFAPFPTPTSQRPP